MYSWYTATFAIAILQTIDFSIRQCQAVILTPTREMAWQVQKVVRALGEYQGVKCHALIGGTAVHKEIDELKNGAQVVVGAPGRVFDMISRQALNPEHVKIFVLDEADKMLQCGFKDLIYDVFRYLPKEIQVFYFCFEKG